MKTRQIPGTALFPSVICLGTSGFGESITLEESFALMDRFLSHGGSFLDTAKVYSDWVPGERSRSEKAIGQWMKLRGSRCQVILATKGAHPDLDTMHIPRLTEEDIRHDLEQSLLNLQTDYIDLYWLHRDDPSRPVEEIIDMLNEYVSQGKIRYFGCSNWRSERIEAARQYAEAKGLQSFAASQIKWSLASYPQGNDPTMVSMDEKELAYYERTGLPVIPYNAQANGFFSGRYTVDQLQEPTPDNRKVWKLCNEDNLRKLKAVETLAERLHLSMSQVALGYLLAHPFPVFPISGCRTLDQLNDTCAAGDVLLNQDAFQELKRIGRFRQ
ncbi:aldo/keto reductase [Paenibacillus vulneris]|uniref:Aldo/keto reductase n=1 Tax=Paenibacillus vulneris TaxID=1133364 RepID=A0ABW3UMR3_9BACL